MTWASELAWVLRDIPIYLTIALIAVVFFEDFRGIEIYNFWDEKFDFLGVFYFLSHKDENHLSNNIRGLCLALCFLACSRVGWGIRNDVRYLFTAVCVSWLVVTVLWMLTPLGYSGGRGMSVRTSTIGPFARCACIVGFILYLCRPGRISAQSEALICVTIVAFMSFVYLGTQRGLIGDGDSALSNANISHSVGYVSGLPAFLLYYFRDMRKQALRPSLGFVD